MSRTLLGIAFLVFGGVSIWDARRIAGTIRRRGTLDIVGPDGYLMGVAVLLLVIGASLVIGAWLQRRRAVTAAAQSQAAEGGYAHFALMGALVVYAAIMPAAGYALSTLAFLVAVFRVMGVSSWVRCVVGALVLTALFYGAFTGIADLPLPRGYHGLG